MRFKSLASHSLSLWREWLRGFTFTLRLVTTSSLKSATLSQINLRPISDFSFPSLKVKNHQARFHGPCGGPSVRAAKMPSHLPRVQSFRVVSSLGAHDCQIQEETGVLLSRLSGLVLFGKKLHRIPTSQNDGAPAPAKTKPKQVARLRLSQCGRLRRRRRPEPVSIFNLCLLNVKWDSSQGEEKPTWPQVVGPFLACCLLNAIQRSWMSSSAWRLGMPQLALLVFAPIIQLWMTA